MRLRLFSLLVAMLSLVAVFAGACGDDDDDGGDDSATATPAASASPEATQASGTIIMTTTTSTQDSGLLDVLVPMFEDESGYKVNVIAVGSGQAIEQASRGDADVVFAHSPAAEKEMVESGNGIERILVMHNDFIMVGPESDPAGIANAATINDVMTAIATTGSQFESRGDDSGTHALELRLWEAASIDPTGESWYEETGQGMGATLTIAGQKQGYTLTDRATFLAQQDNLDLVTLYEGDQSLLNYYHVIVVNPEVHSDVNSEGGQAWADFLVREDIQQLIGEFGVEEFGEPLFYPDAGKEDPTARITPAREFAWT